MPRTFTEPPYAPARTVLPHREALTRVLPDGVVWPMNGYPLVRPEEPRMPPSRLDRFAVTTVACVVLTLGMAGSASAAQTVALLTPADGTAITLKPNTYVRYRWLVSWPEAPKKGTVAITWQLSTD